MRQINIDDMPAGYLLNRIRDNTAYWPRDPRDRLIRPAGYRTMGFRAEALLRWRDLEHRHHQLRSVAQEVSKMYWDVLLALSKRSQELGGKGTVWIVHEDGEYTDVFDGKSCRCCSTNSLVNEAIADPNFRPVVLVGDELLAVRRLKRQDGSWRRRAGTYCLAFRTAVEARVQEFVRTSPEFILYEHYRRAGAFLFNNEGRTYMVTTDEVVKVTWHDVVICTDMLS